MEREAFESGCNDARNHRTYADTLQSKRYLRAYREHYDRGWHSTRDVMHKRNKKL